MCDRFPRTPLSVILAKAGIHLGFSNRVRGHTRLPSLFPERLRNAYNRLEQQIARKREASQQGRGLCGPWGQSRY
jgi:hypothetical protein